MLLALLLLVLFPRAQGPLEPLHITLRPSPSSYERPSGLRVALWFAKSGIEYGRVEARTGEDGATEIDLPVPPEVAGADEQDRILVHAELLESGWQHFDQLGLMPRGARLVEIPDFAFVRGGTLSGNVLTQGPPGGAQVELYLLREGTRAPDRWSPISWNKCVVPARSPFRLHFETAARYRLLARAEGFGSACIEKLELAPEKAQAPLTLTLQGSGSIAGRFVEPGGIPIGRHPIWAVPRALAEGEEVRDAESRSAPIEERGSGLRWCAGLTGLDGEFLLTGLAPGRYWIYSGQPHAGGSVRLREEPVRANAEPITLVGGRHRLELRVLDSAGRTVDAQDNGPFGSELAPRRLLCARAQSGETPQLWRGTPECEDPKRGALPNVFVVEPGVRYVYAFVSHESAPVEGEITIGADDYLSVRELRLPCVLPESSLLPDDERQAGRVELQLFGLDGSLLDHDFQVHVESLQSGLTLFQSPSGSSGSYYADWLPEGRYRVRVDCEENPPWCWTGWNPKPAPFGPWVATVQVVRDRTTKLDVRPWRGGKVRVELAVVDPLGLQTAWNATYPELGTQGWKSLGVVGPGARVTLRADPDGTAPAMGLGIPEPGAPLEFDDPYLRSAHFPAILPGEQLTSHEWIPPGDYTARVEARGFAPAEAKVSIRADEMAQLRIELAPR